MSTDHPGRPRRIFAGGLAHESHSFAATPTPAAAFRAYEWAEPDDLVATYQGTRTSLGGIIAGAAATGLTLGPGFYSFAMPAGPVPATDYAALRERLLASLRAALAVGPIDGVALVCHGAMVAIGTNDVEADLATQVRAPVGPDVPVVMTLDFHANLSAALVAQTDLVVGYDTYPHVDVYERGVEAAHLLHTLITTRPTIHRAYAAIPILAVPQRQHTAAGAMQELCALVQEMEADPGVLTITLAGGFAYSDEPRAGMAVVVATHDLPGTPEDDAAATALRLATRLQAAAWACRDDFIRANTPVGDALAAVAVTPPGTGPVILVDSADNIGAGAPGDGTAVLAALLDTDLSGVVIVIADPAAVTVALAAGIDGDFAALVGGKVDAHHGAPIPVRGRVQLLADGRFTYRGSYMTGQTREMGRTAVIDVRGNQLVLTERKTMPFDTEQLRAVGISPEHCTAIVVKSATAWRAAYAAMASAVIELDTPGIGTANLATLPYARRRRPIFPLDPAADVEIMPPVLVPRATAASPDNSV